MKKIKIIIEDDKKGKIEIPLTQRQIRDLYDFGFMLDYPKDNFLETLKINKCDKSFWDLHKISAKVMDALDEGKCFKFENKKMVPSKHKFYYSGKKPKWRK